MTYINRSRHDARLDGNIRLRLAMYLQYANSRGNTIAQYIR